MKGPPLVTLGMTVWSPRQRSWFVTAVDSALSQRDCRIELLVLDDGSPEPVAPLLGPRLDDERVRMVRIAHAGLSAARNAIVEHARGDYVRFLDDDDAYPPDGTAQLVRAAEGRQDRIAYGTTLVCDAELRPRWRMAPRQDGNAVSDALLARFNVRPGGVLWPRAVFDLAGLFDESLSPSDDWDFTIRALEHAEARRVRPVVHLYRRHPRSMTADVAAGREAARLVVDRYFERHPGQRGSRLERRAYAMLDAQQARVLGTRGQWRPALGHAAAALRRDPLAFGNEMPQVVAALRGRLATMLGRLP